MASPLYGHKSLTPRTSINDLTNIPESWRESLLETTQLIEDDPSPGGFDKHRGLSPQAYSNTTAVNVNGVSIPMFTGKGKSSAAIRGVSQLQFQRLTWYFTLVSLSWPKLFLLSLGLYLSVVVLFTIVYFIMCSICGADTTVIGALYFVVVSIAANGGYMGEDTSVFYPGHRCFSHRTYLVLLASYVSILLGAMIAAVFVSKAATHGKLMHRIVFSDYITLNRVGKPHGKASTGYQLTFRVASITDKPMIRGKLRLYLISRIPWGKFGSVMTPEGLMKGAPPSPVPSSTATETRPRSNTKCPPKEDQHLCAPGSSGSPKTKNGNNNNNKNPSPPQSLNMSIPHSPVTIDSRPNASFGDPRQPPSPTTTEPPLSNSSGSELDQLEADAFRNYGTVPKPTFAGRLRAEPHRAESDLENASARSNASSGSSVAGAVPLSVRVSALEWHCDEEVSFQSDSPREELLLWFPCTIHHDVVPNSPLHCLIAARMSEGSLAHADEHTRWAANVGRLFTPSMFQVVAVYEGTDAETSTTVEAKHVYTPDHILAEHHFAAPTLIFQRQVAGSMEKLAGALRRCFCGAERDPEGEGERTEIYLDYFKFNELAEDDD